jgi:putative membrane protein
MSRSEARAARPGARDAAGEPGASRAPAGLRIAQAALGGTARALARAALALRVEGRTHVPRRGPAVLAVRHVHHLWDGVALLAAMPRPVHLLVGLDWIGDPRTRRAMEAATGAVGWPVIVREEGLAASARAPGAGPRSAFEAHEALAYLRRAHRDVVALLAAGRVAAMFPQGFPRVDPHLTVARDEPFRSFRPGVVRFARAAHRRGIAVPIVPVGIAYAAGEAADPPRPRGAGRLGATLRFGAPLALPAAAAADGALLCELEARVRALSGLP